ncbi:hypothetical protein M433DRAFT_57907 [Acidomyces richmondensis BFW]|nr:MAG: hypothetical protein FE78DRAFT_69645 [Acidomyces sp. 'richmondensis']KYG50063.1 hypothetical protein M433DRAFT_57907 [Acidomyces richmondensis BFW]
MSTIASPRPSITLSSRRDSGSTDTTTRSTSTSRPQATHTIRRNRAALRDYYGLHNAAPADARGSPSPQQTDAEQESELDKPDFDPDTYIQSLLTNEDLEGVLRVEASLVSQIRSLDGEKKALVYDNYSKLIAATDTIRSMREKMDPLTQTSVLVENIEHIAETAARLSAELQKEQQRRPTANGELGELQKKRDQQKTVRWVLGTPERLTRLLAADKRVQAQAEWKIVSHLLDMWEGTPGVEGIREQCRNALKESDAAE